MKSKGLLCSVSLLFCLLAAVLFTILTEPKQTAPQTLLSTEQREQLYRFPKSILEATEEDLMLLDGIGRTRAQAIYSYIQSHNLTSMEQLLEVEGVGDDCLRTLQKYFYLF